MNALLLVAHGSRRAESNQEVAALASRLAARIGDGAEDGDADGVGAGIDLVDHAFLELAEPLIPDGIQRCLDKGATSVRVVPYFLARGTHVAEDIPEQVAIAQRANPDADIRITDYLGTCDALPGLLLSLAR